MTETVYDFVSWYLSEVQINIPGAIQQHVEECFPDPDKAKQAFAEIEKAVKDHPDLHWPGLMHDYP